MPKKVDLESKFRSELDQELKELFPGCDIIVNDEQFRQGIPDRIVLWRSHWAMIETKRSIFSPYRPNQEYYLEQYDNMSVGIMICPENKDQMIQYLIDTWRGQRAV